VRAVKEKVKACPPDLAAGPARRSRERSERLAKAGIEWALMLYRVGAALAFPYFRKLWFGAATSSIGTWMQSVAQNWLVLTISGSAFYLGLDAFLGQLPILLFTLLGGVVADRHDRRRVLLGSQYVQMSTAFALALLVALGAVQVWQILALSFVTGCAQAFGGPAHQ